MKKSIILIVCLSILTALFTHMSPISYAEDSTAIMYDGNAQSFLLLNENETEVLSLSKTADVDASYQWEILIDEENGTWVELENQTDDQYEVVYQTLRDLTGEEDNTVQLRCRMTVNEEVSYSEVLDVELFEKVFVTNTFGSDESSDDAEVVVETEDELTETDPEDDYQISTIEDEEILDGEEQPEEEEPEVEEPEWMSWSSYDEFLAYQYGDVVWENPEIYIGLTAVFNTTFWNGFTLTDDPLSEGYMPTGNDEPIFQTVNQAENTINVDDKYIGENEFELVEDLKVVIDDVCMSEVDGGILWFKVSAVEGYTLPEELEKYPWVLQLYFPEDFVALSFVPTEGMFVGEKVSIQKELLAATRSVVLNTADLPSFFDVTPCSGDGFHFYDLGDITSWSSEITSSSYRYVFDSSVILIPAEVTDAYNRLMETTSTMEYNNIFSRIPEAVLNEFSKQHEQNVQSHFDHLYAVENVEVKSTVSIDGVEVDIAVKGKVPETATLSIIPVSNDALELEGFDIKNVSDIVLALDIKVLNNDESEWQPEDGFPVELEIDMASLGYEDGTVFKLHHKHGDSIRTYDIFVVEDGKLTIQTGGFSIYVVDNTTDTTGTAITPNNVSATNPIELSVGETVVYYFNRFGNNTDNGTTPNVGTWQVNDPEGAIHYTVHTNNTNATIGNGGVNARWIKIVALKETTSPITITFTNGETRETYYISVETPKAKANGKLLYIKDTVNTTGCITAVLVDQNGNELSLDGAAFSWKRSDPTLIVAAAYENNYRSVNIARDHGGLVEARKNEAQRKYDTVTYTVTVTLPDDSKLNASYTVYYQSEIINAGFEFPNSEDNNYAFFPNGWPELYWKTTAPGIRKQSNYTWTNNVTKDIEYGDVTSHREGGTNYGVTYAADHADGGVQFAELNAEEVGALYQDIITVPGEDIEWDFAHAKRPNQSWASNVQNQMFIVLGATERAQELSNDQLNALVRQAKNQAGNNTAFLSGNTYVKVTYNESEYWVWYHDAQDQDDTSARANYGWELISGSYTVPTGQYRTRIFFVSDPDSNASNPNAGNLIDISSAGQYKSYLIEYYEETFDEGVKMLTHKADYDESGEAIIYSSEPMENFDHFINVEHDYLHSILINGENYPYDIRYAETPALYIQKYEGEKSHPEGCDSGNDYSQYDIVMQVFFRDTVIAVQKVLELPSQKYVDGKLVDGMTEEQKLTLMNQLKATGGYKTYFHVYNIDDEDYEFSAVENSQITDRDPIGNYKGYRAVGENPELNHTYIVEELKEYDDIVQALLNSGKTMDEIEEMELDENYDLIHNLEGLELDHVSIEVTRYSQGNKINDEYTINSYDKEDLSADDLLTSVEIPLINNEKEPSKSVKIADVTVTNYYKEKLTTVYYQAIGKGKVKLDGTDWEDKPSETLAFYSGKAKGGVVSIGEGATFVGWFKDPSCSEESRVTEADGVYDKVTHSFKPNANIINAEEVTFYAKFITGSIVIEKTGVTDPDQVFVYHVTNNLTDGQHLDMYVTVTADENGKYQTQINEIPDGKYTVTEVTDWNWRYQNQKLEKDYKFQNDKVYTFTFAQGQSSDKLKWLNGFDVLKNIFGKMTQEGE